MTFCEIKFSHKKYTHPKPYRPSFNMQNFPNTFIGALNVTLIKAQNHAREPLYSNSAVIVWWLQSTSLQNRVPTRSS